MKNLLLLFSLVLFTSFNTITVNDDEVAIRKVMADQQMAWNNYDLEGFMQGYWKSEDLKFYGSNGVTYGWNNMLALDIIVPWKR